MGPLTFPNQTPERHISYQGSQGKMLEGRFSLPSNINISLLLEGKGSGMRPLTFPNEPPVESSW